MVNVFLSTSEAARRARCSAANVQLAVREGRLRPDATTEGGQNLFQRDTVMAWARTIRRRRPLPAPVRA